VQGIPFRVIGISFRVYLPGAGGFELNNVGMSAGLEDADLLVELR
jgi:hypothetical protein